MLVVRPVLSQEDPTLQRGLGRPILRALLMDKSFRTVALRVPMSSGIDLTVLSATKRC